MRPHPRPNHEVMLYNIANFKPVLLPQFLFRVECGTGTTGFVSPADDYITAQLDLNEYHNIKKYATFLVEAVGESNSNASQND